MIGQKTNDSAIITGDPLYKYVSTEKTAAETWFRMQPRRKVGASFAMCWLVCTLAHRPAYYLSREDDRYDRILSE